MSLSETLFIVSMVFQIGVIAFVFYVLLTLPQVNRRPWFWFLLSLLGVLGRRVLSLGRDSFCSGLFFHMELEYCMTILISACWVVFTYSFLFVVLNSGKKRECPECLAELLNQCVITGGQALRMEKTIKKMQKWLDKDKCVSQKKE